MEKQNNPREKVNIKDLPKSLCDYLINPSTLGGGYPAKVIFPNITEYVLLGHKYQARFPREYECMLRIDEAKKEILVSVPYQGLKPDWKSFIKATPSLA